MFSVFTLALLSSIILPEPEMLNSSMSLLVLMLTKLKLPNSSRLADLTPVVNFLSLPLKVISDVERPSSVVDLSHAINCCAEYKNNQGFKD